MKYVKKFTVKEWKKFDKITTDRVDGNYLTMQEILLDKYKVILTDFQNKHCDKFCDISLKEKLKGGLKTLPSKINQKNFDKGMEIFDKGMDDFNKEMKELSKGMGGDGKKPKIYSSKPKTLKVYSDKRKKKAVIPTFKIWNDPPKKKRKKQKSSKSDKWDDQERHHTKIWSDK